MKQKKMNCVQAQKQETLALSELLGVGLSGWIFREWRKMRLERGKNKILRYLVIMPRSLDAGCHTKTTYLDERDIPQKETFQNTEICSIGQIIFQSVF